MMVKGQVLRNIGLGILGLATIVGGVSYYYWYQLTSVPTGYMQSLDATSINLSTNLSTLNLAESPEQSITTSIQQKIQESLQNNGTQSTPVKNPNLISPSGQFAPASNSQPKLVEIQFDEAELTQLIVAEISQRVRKQPVLAAVKGVNTSLQADRVKAGAVINLSRISPDHLNDRQRQAIDRLNSLLPGLKNRDFYVGLEGSPQFENGTFKLDHSITAKIGNLSFTLTDLAQRLGLSPKQLEQQINALLQTQPLKIQGVQLRPDQLLIEGWVN